jgi:NAD(P)-dependent dehydrogenase (short-subunit alcohol dehydrogenase family)
MRDVLIVTGGGRGIGAAVSRLAATRGYAVCVNYRSDAEAAREVVQAITDEGGTALAVAADVSRQAEVERLFQTVDRELGRVTALVNNAGVVAPQGRVDQLDERRLTRLFTTNINSAFLCSKEAVLRMSTTHGGPGGAIVNVSSAAATLGSPGEYVHYAATKAAVDAMTVGLSKELGPEGIRVNAVAPGVIQTGIHAAAGDPDRPTRIGAATPLGRPGRPEEVAAAIAWLLGPEASYTTGTVLRVAGGR